MLMKNSALQCLEFNTYLRVDFTVALGYSISVREDNGNIYYNLGGI